MKIVIFILTFQFFLFSSLMAQSPSLSGFGHVSQSLELSPATIPEMKFYCGLPDANVFSATNYTLQDIFSTEGDSLRLDLAKWNSANSGALQTQLNQRLRLFDIGFSLNPKNYIYLGGSAQLNQNIALPAGMLSFVESGKSLNFNGFNLNASAHSEYFIGAVQRFGDFTVGIRYKFLNGIFNLETVKNQFDVKTGPDSIIILTDLQFRSSNLQGRNDLGELATKIPSVNDFLPISSNIGHAIDFGVNYSLKEKFIFTFSTLNILGSINWSNNLTLYSSHSNYNYLGPVINVGSGDSLNIFSSIQDSLESQFSIDTIPSSVGYRTTLPAQLIFQFHYQPLNPLGVGLIYRQPLNNHNLLNFGPSAVAYVEGKWKHHVAGRIAYNFSKLQSGIAGLVSLRIPYLGLQTFFGVESIRPFYAQSLTKLFQFQAGLSFCFDRRFRPVVVSSVTQSPQPSNP